MYLSKRFVADTFKGRFPKPRKARIPKTAEIKLLRKYVAKLGGGLLPERLEVPWGPDGELSYCVHISYTTTIHPHYTINLKSPTSDPVYLQFSSKYPLCSRHNGITLKM